MKLAKRINQFLIIIMVLGTLLALYNSISQNQTDRLLTQVAQFPVLLVPFILHKCSIRFNDIMQTYFYIFIFLAQFLGCVLNFYGIFKFYDVFMHFLSGIAFSFLALYVLEMSHQPKLSLFISILFILGMTCLSAVSWEIYEFGCDQLLGMNVQHAVETGVVDTMEDMIAAFGGTILFCILYIVEDSKKKKGIISLFKEQVTK